MMMGGKFYIKFFFVYHFYDISEHVFDVQEFRGIVGIISPGTGIFVAFSNNSFENVSHENYYCLP